MVDETIEFYYEHSTLQSLLNKLVKSSALFSAVFGLVTVLKLPTPYAEVCTFLGGGIVLFIWDIIKKRK